VNPDCLEKFQSLKFQKKLTYIIFTLNKANTEIVVELSSESTDYEDFIKDLPETECRWGVIDFKYKEPDGSSHSKLIFVSWSPDDAKIKQKMLFASSRDALKRSLVGIAKEIQGTDYSEVDYDNVLKAVTR